MCRPVPVCTERQQVYPDYVAFPSVRCGDDLLKHLKENLLVQFSAASFLVMVLIEVALAAVLSNAIRSDAVEDLVDEAIGATTDRLLTVIDSEDLETPMTGVRYDEFHDFVQEYIVSGRTARIKVWSKDGTVIYSSDPAGVGKRFPTKENLLVALSGQISTEMKIADDSDNEPEEFLGTLMEVYTPIVFEGSDEPQGAFEIYQYYQPTVERIESLRRWVILSIGLGFLVLYGSLVSIVWRGWRTINRQQNRLETANEQLTQEMSERKQLQQQLIQSQKMEAVGQLAGGIAHDFNNLLTPILSYAQLVNAKLTEGNPLRSHLREIARAAERAAGLTRQLLVFSHHQVVQTAIIELNEIIEDTEKMLRRLIGENIELVTSLDRDLWVIEADPGQIEQVVMNLTVNARDAMPKDGKITIATSNVTLRPGDDRVSPDLAPGNYVLLTLSDTGEGMTDDVKTHIFEPFFTTKGVGKGTGLGLSTCFGIIRLCGGSITVESEPKRGTTFSVYLPKTSLKEAKSDDDGVDDDLPRGRETILLVEDEPSVREVAGHVLRDLGYTVLEAENGVEALGPLNSLGDCKVGLLLTDLVMPLMGGREFAEKFTARYPEAKVLYTSGYNDDLSSADEGSNLPEESLIHKPFTPASLARKVREVLDGAHPSRDNSEVRE